MHCDGQTYEFIRNRKILCRVTHYMRHVTCDTRHVTCDVWHMVWGVHSLKISAPYLLQFVCNAVLKILRKRIADSINGNRLGYTVSVNDHILRETKNTCLPVKYSQSKVRNYVKYSLHSATFFCRNKFNYSCVKYLVWTLYCKVCIVLCTVYSVHCKVYSLQ